MKKVLLGASCLALIACAPPTRFLEKTYQPSQLAGKSIFIYPVSANQVHIENQDEFADDFEDVKESPSQFMQKEINDKAARYFQAGFKTIGVISGAGQGFQALDPSNSDKITAKINQEDFEIRIPKASYLEGMGLKPRFVLVLDQGIFNRNLETTQSITPGTSTMGPGGKRIPGEPGTATTSRKYLAFGLNYLMYDYEDKAVVGYGFVKGESTFSFSITRIDWYKCMENAFGKIKEFSPFK